MSFLDSIVDSIKSVGGAASKYVGSAVDWATAPTNPVNHAAAQTWDFLTKAKPQADMANKVYQAVTGSDAAPVKPEYLSNNLNNALNDLNLPYKYAIDRPLQTPIDTVLEQIGRGQTGLNALLPDSWSDVRDAWNTSANRSLGQSAQELAASGPTGAAIDLATIGSPLSPIGLTLGGGATAGATLAGAATGTQLTPDLSSPGAQKKFEAGKLGGPAALSMSIQSGATDLVANFALDPLNLTGAGYASIAEKSRGAIKGAKGLGDLAKNLNGDDTGTSVAKNLKGMHEFLEDSRNRAIARSNKTTEPIPVETQHADGTVTTSLQAMTTADFNPMWIKNAAPQMPMSVAVQLAEAQKITDQATRVRAYNDIIAASAGDTTALSRLSNASAKLGALAKRAGDPNETEVLDQLQERGRFIAGDQGTIDTSTGAGRRFAAPARPTDDDVLPEAAQTLLDQHMGWVQAIHGDNLDAQIATLNRLDNTAHELRYIPKMSAARAYDIQTGKNIAPLSLPFRKKSQAEMEVAFPGYVEAASSPYEPGALVLRDPNERLNKMYRAFATQVATGSIDLKDTDRGVKQIAAYLQAAHADPRLIEQLQSKYVTALTSTARQNVAEVVEKEAFNALGARYGYGADEVNDIAAQISQSRRAHLFRQNSFSAVKEDGKRLDARPHLDPDGKIVSTREPVLATQDISVTHLSDINKVARKLSRDSQVIAARGSFLHGLGVAGVKGAHGAWDVAEVAPSLMRLWKAEVLFRLGYPVRNLIDNDLSTYANVGGSILSSVVHQRLKSIGRIGNVGVGKRIANDEIRLASLKATGGDEQEIAALERKLDNPRGYLKGIPKEQREGVKLPNGQVGPAWDAGPEGELLRSRLSAGIGQAMSDNMSRTLKEVLDTSGSWVDVKPGDAGHLEAWANALNKQILQDKAAQQVLGGMDEHQLARWLKNTPEGKEYGKRVPARAANPEDWAERIVKHVRGTATDDVVALLGEGKGKVTAEQLSRVPKDRRPPVNGGQAEQSLASVGTVSRYMEHINARVMRLIGDLPDEALGRQPLAAALYRQRFTELLSSHPNGWAEPEDIQRMARASRKYALEKVQRAVYDTHFHTNGARYASIVSPFANAWQESLRRYGIAAWNNPHRLWNLYKVYESPAKMGAVVDENGNKVDHFDPLDPGNTYLQIPLIGWKPNGKMGVVDYRLNMSSFNVAIQGNPWWSPGAGPLVQLPMQELTKKFPSLEDTYEQWVSPYGPTSSVADVFKSAAVRRAWELYRGDSNDTFHQQVIQIMQEQHTAYLQGKRQHDIKPDQAISMARKLIGFQFVASLTAPAIPRQNSAYQFYRDQWRKLSDEGRQKHPGNPGWASEQFLSQFGDTFFTLTESASKNNAGLEPTAQAIAGFKKHRGTISQLENAKLAGSVVGPDGAGGKFNQAAYRSEYGTQVTTRGGDSPENMARSSQTLGEYEDNVQLQDAWTQYNQFMTDIDAWVIDKLGPDASYQDSPQATAMRNQLIQRLSFNDDGSYTPFGKEWGSMDAPGAYGSYVNDYMKVVKSNDPSLKNRADVKVLRQYVQARQQITDVLQQRQAEGLSGNIEAKQNSDVRYLFSRIVNQLAHSNTTFNDNWYQKYIVHDPYYDDTLVKEVAA